jgi:LmbE family N-acetylglucosaminyl deacetylase
MLRKLTSFLFLFICVTTQAQPPQSPGSAEIYLNLRKLNVLGSVLYIAAHPDDENTRLLAYLSKEKLYRTGYLSLTRGDGGQNLIGDEQGVDLGLIRTQELLAARRTDGAEQFFTRAFDFGFSKSPEETFKHWNKELILSDVVWVIRKFRPDVLIARFPTTGEGGHGHHTASAILAQEAFSAAADPKRFPEQLKYVQPWQAQRLLWNTFNFGNNNTQRDDQYKTDVGVFNAILGKGYGEIAAESRSQHKSQGFGVPRQRGQVLEYFKTLQGTAPVNDLLDGVTANWGRVPGGNEVTAQLNTIINNYSFINPSASVPALVNLYRLLNRMEDGYWKNQKQKEVQQLIEQCSGLFLDATTAEPYAVQTDSVRINFFINNRSNVKATLNKIVADVFDSSFAQKSLAGNTNLAFSKTMPVSFFNRLSQPYWLKEEMGNGYFNISDQQLIGDADSKPAYEARFELTIEGEPFVFTRPVQYKFTDPVRGELYQPLVITPPLLVDAKPNLLLSFSQQNQPVRINVTARKDIVNAASMITPPEGWKVVPTGETAIKNDTLKKGSERSFYFTLSPTKTAPKEGKLQARSAVDYMDERYTVGMRGIRYDHIPNLSYYRSSATSIVHLDLKTVGKTVGFIEGAGDYTPTALKLMGYDVKLLSDDDLQNENLDKYDAIITGVRAYNTKESLTRHYDRLMKYIENGGTLLVQYNTNNQIGPVRAKISPYPFTISRDRVTDETAKVSFLQPAHRVLNFPNKISDKDFEGWVQERGIYYATALDSNYTAILSMNDPGEKPMDGSLVVAKYGKGHFVYTGLALFRQLPAGVPGAYRLLANLVALSKKYL